MPGPRRARRAIHTASIRIIVAPKDGLQQAAMPQEIEQSPAAWEQRTLVNAALGFPPGDRFFSKKRVEKASL
jgi:hypothetical protein